VIDVRGGAAQQWQDGTNYGRGRSGMPASRSILHGAPRSRALSRRRDATTVAALLHSRKMQDEIRNGVLLIDEAGLLSAPQLKQVAPTGAERTAALFSPATPRNIAPSKRGDALRLLERHAALQAVEIKKDSPPARPPRIGSRQACVMVMSRGALPVWKSLARSWKSPPMNATDARRDYLQAVKDNKSAWFVSPTHAEGGRVTEKFRGVENSAKTRRNGKGGRATQESPLDGSATR